jgi:regulator of sigma E protease
VFYFEAVAALALLIVVHEGGHFWVARWCSMRIERFSIGFGPGILKHRSDATGTTFQLAPIPFGGFVEIQGMNLAEEVDPADRFAYPNRPVWQRFLTIFAGPATNYLAAIVVMFAVYTCHGMETDRAHVGDVKPDYDAVGKLAVGDQVVAVDHDPVSGANQTLSEMVSARGGKAVLLTVERPTGQLDADDNPIVKTFEVTVKPKQLFNDDGTPALDKKTNQPVYLLGIVLEYEVTPVSPTTAIGKAIAFPIDTTRLISNGLYDIITGEQPADPGGPVRIVSEFHKAFENSFVSGLKLMATLSVYLGLFNLFPLPALDGGRLVFLVYEMVTRRRANPKIEATVHMAGILVLGLVMILVLVRDCRNVL